MIIDLLASGNYITFSKPIARKIGISGALLLGHLASIQVMKKEKEFTSTMDEIIHNTCLSDYEIRKAKKELQKIGVLSIIKKGLPAKDHYQIIEEELRKLFSTSDTKFDSTGSSKNDSTGSGKFDSTYLYRENYYKNNNKNIKKETQNPLLELLNECDFSKEISDKILLWLDYKKEKNSYYKSIGFKSFLTKVKNALKENEESFILKRFDLSMENNYQGVFFNKKGNTKVEPKSSADQEYRKRMLEDDSGFYG